MTYVKKLSSDWQPQEFPGSQVGDVIDFPGSVQKLIQENLVSLCDEKGNPVSAYDAFGITTEGELNEFREWKKQQAQISLKKSLESEKETLLAEAAKLKKEISSESADQKKKDFAARMAAGKAKKAAERATANG